MKLKVEIELDEEEFKKEFGFIGNVDVRSTFISTLKEMFTSYDNWGEEGKIIIAPCLEKFEVTPVD